MSMTGISDFLLSAGHPDDIAVVDGTTTRTYAELRSAAAHLVTVLHERGVAPGDRIALLGPNSFFWIAAYLAAMRWGRRFRCPMRPSPTISPASSTGWTARPCSSTVGRSAATAISCAIGDGHRRRPSRAGGASWVDADSEPEPDAVWMFTSGTTARPKAVRVAHTNLHTNTASILAYLGLQRTDRTLVILPFHYCFGASLLHTSLAVGARVVLCNSFVLPQSALDLLEREACTVLAGVPSTFQLLLRASSYPTQPLASLRLVQQAGGRLPPATIEALVTAQPQSRLFVMYGQTEATARLSYLPPDRLTDKAGSIGRGIPGSNSRSSTVRPARGPGEQGEIVARGASISPGYHRDPEESARKFRGGVLRTGDLATVDEDGFIFIVGRCEGFIKSWGHRISPQQIETAVLSHPGVAEAAVVGLPDLEAGERIVLAMVGTASTTPTVPEVSRTSGLGCPNTWCLTRSSSWKHCRSTPTGRWRCRSCGPACWRRSGSLPPIGRRRGERA